jgi:pilin isopeptide linkage protein
MKFTTKKFGSIATAAVLAGTMAFMPATAFAVTFDDTSSTDVAKTTVVNKEWDVASPTLFNKEEPFTFNVQFTGATNVGSWTPTTFDKSVVNTVSLPTNSWTKNADGTIYTTSMNAKTLLGNYNFTAPGVYNFKVSEAKGENPNISYDTKDYTVTVVVTMPEDYPTDPDAAPVIESVGVRTTDGNGKTTKTTADFKNDKAKNDSLKVSKVVSGTAANTGDEFTYTLTLTGVQGSYDYVKTGVGTTADDKGTIKSGDTFKLKHGQTIEIKNLPEGATYTVEETDTDYKEFVKAQGSDSFTESREATGTINSQSSVEYKNEYGFATDTGITMNTLPFVVVATVAVAGGAALVISRRRHAGEDF